MLEMKEGILVASRSAWAKRLAGAALILLVLAISGWLAFARPDFESLGVYGYPGLFLIMAASSASIFVPLPGLATVVAAGSIANPFLVAIFGGMGSAIGEMTGYAAGYGGRSIIDDRNVRFLKYFERWLRSYVFLTLVVFAAVPNPFFDLAGVAAGSLGYPAKRFLFAVAIGKVLKCLLLAYLGKATLPFLLG